MTFCSNIYSGLLFQVVCDLKRRKNKMTMDTIAAGGRYDGLIKNFRFELIQLHLFVHGVCIYIFIARFGELDQNLKSGTISLKNILKSSSCFNPSVKSRPSGWSSDSYCKFSRDSVSRQIISCRSKKKQSL